MEHGKKLVEMVRNQNKEKLDKSRNGLSIKDFLAKKKKEREDKFSKAGVGMGASKVKKAKSEIREKLLEKYNN